MTLGRWITWIGSALLFVFGILHGTKLSAVETMIQASSVKALLDGIVRASWLGFSLQMITVAMTASVASTLQRGGSIVLICGATMAVNGLLLVHFLGPFIGVYMAAIVILLFVAGGLLQLKQPE